jgi:hypothetical protein
MSFGPGERDLVMLQHKFVVEWSDGNKVRSVHSSLTLMLTSYDRIHSHLRSSSLVTLIIFLAWLFLSA